MLVIAVMLAILENGREIQRQWKCRPTEHHGGRLFAVSLASMPPLLPTAFPHCLVEPPLRFQPLRALGLDPHWLEPVRILISLGFRNWLRNEGVTPWKLMKLEGTFAEVSKKRKEKKKASTPWSFQITLCPLALNEKGYGSEQPWPLSWEHRGRGCPGTELIPRGQRGEVREYQSLKWNPRASHVTNCFNSVTQFPFSFQLLFIFFLILNTSNYYVLGFGLAPKTGVNMICVLSLRS